MRPPRDPWELADDRPMLWRTLVQKRAQALGQTVETEARWMLFALQSVLEAIPLIPSNAALREILLYGALANGAPDDVMRLLAITRTDALRAAQNAIWEELGDLCTQAEQMYAVRIDCLIVGEKDLGEMMQTSPLWPTIANDYVVVWSTMPTN